MKLKFLHFIPAIIWLCISVFLLCVPGNDLPKAQFFDVPQRDKLVHITMFFLISYLFSRPFKLSLFTAEERRSWFLSIALYALAYGIVMEFVQKYFIPNRSYDRWDILADGVGSFLGYWYSIKFFSAKKSRGEIKK